MLPLLRKEARALGPTALAAIGIIALAATGMREHVVHESLGSGVSLLGLLFGVATLSAHGIGHEFIGSTLAALFMQPVSRGPRVGFGERARRQRGGRRGRVLCGSLV